MLKELESYDWSQVFQDEGSGCCSNHENGEAVVPGLPKIDAIRREDILSIRHIHDPGNVHEWGGFLVGETKDRFVVARGSCDYTGWG